MSRIIALKSLRAGARVAVFTLLILFCNYASAQFTQVPGLYGGYVLSLTKIGENVFAGALGGVFRSTDNGATWQSVSSGLTNLNVNSLLAVGSRLYVSTNGGGSYLSDNEGTTWTPIITVPPGRTFTRIQATANEVYALTNASELYTIDGTSATMVVTSLTNQRSMTTTSSKIFVGTTDGLFQSTDEGSTWTAASGWTIGGVYNLSSTGDIVVALPFSGPNSISYDNGNSWTSLGFQPNNPSVTAVIGGNVYVGSPYAAYKTPLGSADPFVTVPGLPAMAGIVSNSTAIFAGSEDGVYRSTDGGATWSISNTGMTSAPIFKLASDGTTVYAAVGRKVMSYNGTAWTNLNAPSSYGFPFLSLLVSENVLVAGTYGTGVVVSADKGATWTTATGVVGATSLASIGNKLYASNYEGIFESTGGTSWVKVLDKGYATAMGSVGSDLYISSSISGITRWSNGIATDVNAGLPASSFAYSFTGIGEQVFCGFANHGLYTSTNKGSTWTKLPVNGAIESMLVNSDIIYAAHAQLGILVSADKGATWKPYNDGLPTNVYYDTFGGISELAVVGTTLYAGGMLAGVWKSCAIIPPATITATGLNTLSPQLSSSITTGNQWYLNGTAIAAATGQTIAPTASGTYTVVVTKNGCASQASAGFDFVVLGVDDTHNEFSVYAYPNPARGAAQIGVRGLRVSEQVDVVVYDMNGKRVTNGTVTGEDLLPVASTAGTYVVKVVSGQRVRHVRLVIY